MYCTLAQLVKRFFARAVGKPRPPVASPKKFEFAKKSSKNLILILVYGKDTIDISTLAKTTNG